MRCPDFSLTITRPPNWCLADTISESGMWERPSGPSWINCPSLSCQRSARAFRHRATSSMTNPSVRMAATAKAQPIGKVAKAEKRRATAERPAKVRRDTQSTRRRNTERDGAQLIPSGAIRSTASCPQCQRPPEARSSLCDRTSLDQALVFASHAPLALPRAHLRLDIKKLPTRE